MPVADRGPMRCWLGFAGVYAAAFAVLGVYMQFVPVWLCYVQGFDTDELAIVLAGQTIARTIAGPLWAQHVDRRGEARPVLVLLAALSLFAFAAFALTQHVLGGFLVAVAFGCVYPPMYPILDATAVQVAAQEGFSFGRLRMVGSLSFLVVIVAAGYLLERFGNPLVYPLVLGGFVLTALAALGLPRSREARLATPLRTPWWHLLRSRPLSLLLISSALIQGSHATFYNLSTVHWQEHGIGKATAAWLWAEGILAEILLFFFAPRLFERWRPTTLMMLGAFAAVVRWIAIGATTDIGLLFAANWLHAFTFAGTYLGAIRALDRRVPSHQRATAQGLLAAASSGFGMTIAGVVGGFVYERFAAGAFFVMAAFAVAGGLLALRLRRMADKASASETATPANSPP